MSKATEVKIFPFPLVAHNVEGLYARHSRKSRAIYLTIVLGLIGFGLALPFINVQVSTRSQGILRPIADPALLTTAVSGQVIYSQLQNNRTVAAGDTLLMLDTDELTNQKEHLRPQVEEHRRFLTDLERMLQSSEENYPSLESALYQRDYQRFRREQEELKVRLQHAQRQYDRQEQLSAAGAISRAELEQAAFELQLAQAAVATSQDNQRRLWSQEKQRYQRELQGFLTELNGLDEQSERYVLLASQSGSLTQTTGIRVGGFAAAGQSLGTISATEGLIAEVFVSTADIGLIEPGMPVQFQMDAFNSNQWGLVSGQVIEISKDIQNVNDIPVFLVKCRMDSNKLSLKNGYEGELRKGMTLTAHFQLANRSLFQLLYDKVDDWLSPYGS
ncbi:MAG: HlyD family efflux transporter periplasmic adaptor subunit [Bacteroidota bacterium]